MIPAAGEIYLDSYGNKWEILRVDLTSGMEIEHVMAKVGDRPMRLTGTQWGQLAQILQKVPPEAPAPAPVFPRFQFVERLLPDLKTMQMFDRYFAMGVGAFDLGYTGTDDVTVLVGRGQMAHVLKDLGLLLHKNIVEQKKNAPKPENN